MISKRERKMLSDGWVGSPSSYGGELSYSSTSNKHINNLQAIPGSYGYISDEQRVRVH